MSHHPVRRLDQPLRVTLVTEAGITKVCLTKSNRGGFHAICSCSFPCKRNGLSQ
jgi:hypothetical protein